MVRVMATGVFDILHPGHLHFLEEARKLGTNLWWSWLRTIRPGRGSTSP